MFTCSGVWSPLLTTTTPPHHNTNSPHQLAPYGPHLITTPPHHTTSPPPAPTSPSHHTRSPPPARTSPPHHTSLHPPTHASPPEPPHHNTTSTHQLGRPLRLTPHHHIFCFLLSVGSSMISVFLVLPFVRLYDATASKVEDKLASGSSSWVRSTTSCSKNPDTSIIQNNINNDHDVNREIMQRLAILLQKHKI
jgi:hypothetical protein